MKKNSLYIEKISVDEGMVRNYFGRLKIRDALRENRAQKAQVNGTALKWYGQLLQQFSLSDSSVQRTVKEGAPAVRLRAPFPVHDAPQP